MLNTAERYFEETTSFEIADDVSVKDTSPVFYTLNLIGNHRKTSVILLLDKLQRADFDVILSHFSGMNQFVLIKILRDLEADCIIKRVTLGEYGEENYHVKYRLTYTGRRLIPIIDELDSWGKEQRRHKALISY